MPPIEKWKQKALGIYIPEGIIAKGAETVRVYVQKTAKTFAESQSEYYEKTHNFKAIYGKKFGSNNFIRKGKEKIKNIAVKKAYQIGSEELNKYLDGKYDSATGTTIAKEISTQELDYKLSMKLYNCTGYVFDENKFLKTFTDEISNEDEKYHYYDEWRKEIIPDVLKNAYEEERFKLFFDLKSRFAKGNPIPNKETVEKVLNEGAKALGDIFEDFSIKLANNTGVLNVPPRFIKNPEEDLEEMPEGLNEDQEKQWKNVVRPGLIEKEVLDKKIKEVSSAYLSIEEIKKRIPNYNTGILSAQEYFGFYEKNPDSAVNTAWDYGKWFYDSVSGALSSSVSAVKNIANITMSASKYVANEAYNYSTAFIKKMTGMEEDVVGSLPRWQQKALDIYIPNGIIADQTEKARVYVKNLIKEKIKENRDWYEKNNGTFKEIYRKAYGKNNKATKLNQKIVNASMTTVLDITDAYVSDLLDGKYKSSNGKDVAECLKNNVDMSLTIANKLKSETGYEFDQNAFMNRFREELSHEDQQYHYDDDWRKKLMPEILKAAYRDELKRMYEGISRNFEKDSMTSSRELYRSAIESGTRIMGEFFEQFGENIANNTEYLDIPPKLVKNADEDLEAMPRGLTIELQDKWAKQVVRPGLFENEKELDESIKKAVSGYKLPSAEKAYTDFSALMKSNRGEDVKEICGILLLKDLKKKNSERGFFNRIFNFRKNRNEKKRIKEMEKILKEKYMLTDEVLNDLSLEGNLSVKDIKDTENQSDNALENLNRRKTETFEAEEENLVEAREFEIDESEEEYDDAIEEPSAEEQDKIFDKELGKKAAGYHYTDDTEISYSDYRPDNREKTDAELEESGLNDIYDPIEDNPEIQSNVDENSKEGMFSYFKSYVVYTPDSKRNEGNEEINSKADQIGQDIKDNVEKNQTDGMTDEQIISKARIDVAKLIYMNDIRIAMNMEANNNKVFEYQKYLDPKVMDAGIKHIMSSPAFERFVSKLTFDDINYLTDKKYRDKLHQKMIAQRAEDKEVKIQKESEKNTRKKQFENARKSIKEEVKISKGAREI